MLPPASTGESEQSELTQHCHLIPLLPSLDDHAGHDVVEDQPVDAHVPPCCRYIAERSSLRALVRPACRDLVPGDRLVLDREAKVGEGSEESRHHLLEAAE